MLYPVQYNPVTQKTRIYTDVTLELTPSGKKGINTLKEKNIPGKASRTFNQIFKQHFINYNETDLKYTSLPEDGTNMLIICYSDFMDEMQPFVEWKRCIGYNVEIINYSEIGSSSSLKTYVGNYYSNNGLDFLLLVGDHTQVPSSSTSAGVSDNNYGYISGNDHYLDIFVGRFSAEQKSDVTTQVDRTINYEKEINSSANYIYGGVGIASNEGGSSGDDSESDEEHMNNIETDLEDYGYSIDRVYQDGGNASDLTNHLNAGRGLINYVGHGNSTSWSSMTYTSDDVNSLKNTNKLPFIFSVACLNGNFTNTTCFAETWLRATYNNQPAGAIAFSGSTINQYWAPPMCAQDEINDLLVTDNWMKYGSVFVNGMFQMIDEYGTDGEDMADTWVCFGDPSLHLRTPGHPSGPLNVTISGPNPACASNATYSLNNLPSDATVIWSAIPTHLFTNTSGTGTSFSTAWDGSGSGSGTITATLSGDCGSVDVEKEVWLGPPLQPTIIPLTYIYGGGEATFRAYLEESEASTYNWSVMGGSIIRGQGTEHLEVMVYPVTHLDLHVSAGNACGTGPLAFKSFDVSNGGGPASVDDFSVHPNPADHKFTISLEGAKQTRNTEAFEYLLYNVRHQMVRRIKTTDVSVEINAADLESGIYFLNIVAGDKILKRKIEIRH
jgi:hypothetical protein